VIEAFRFATPIAGEKLVLRVFQRISTKFGIWYLAYTPEMVMAVEKVGVADVGT